MITERSQNLGEAIARLAREWAAAKVPYQHRGTTRGGCDCTGLVIGIARELGYLADYELRQYPPDWNLHAGAGDQVIEELAKYAGPVDRGRAQPGDIAVMNFGKCPAHCGIIVAPLLMVHCWRDGGGCKYGRLASSPWGRRWSHTYRFDREKLRQ